MAISERSAWKPRSNLIDKEFWIEANRAQSKTSASPFVVYRLQNTLHQAIYYTDDVLRAMISQPKD